MLSPFRTVPSAEVRLSIMHLKPRERQVLDTPRRSAQAEGRFVRRRVHRSPRKGWPPQVGNGRKAAQKPKACHPMESRPRRCPLLAPPRFLCCDAPAVRRLPALANRRFRGLLLIWAGIPILLLYLWQALIQP